MPFFSRLFGRGSAPEAAATGLAPVDYKGFRIFPEPIREGAQYRVAARIEGEVGGEVKTHSLVRADTMGDREAAVGISLAKARQLIDEQGERLFR